LAKSKKYYVVWNGRQPGVYLTWDDCQAQVRGFEQAKFKSFDRLADAEAAFLEHHAQHIKLAKRGTKKTETPERSLDQLRKMGVDMSSICVDAACSGNPGVLEYKGVTMDGKLLFHRGPFPEGTVNLGEFLGIVHSLAYLRQRGFDWPVYSDSRTAIAWVRKKAINTNLVRSPKNEKLFELVDRALKWLRENEWPNRVLKWETAHWGEIPADFGRK